MTAWSLVVVACRGPVAEPAPPTTPNAEVHASDDGAGGRLFDKWYAELDIGFAPGKHGGPRGDGTLRSATGATLLPDGHEYRLKNLFGWDLRGTSGIYGPAYMNKPYVLEVDLLTDRRTRAELAAWLATGDERVPAFAEVLSAEQLDQIAGFVVDVREGWLPRPDGIFELSADTPNNYRLRAGGDATEGVAIYGSRCASCHGADGNAIAIDETHGVGSYARTKAYEVWFKILNGQPGTAMHREIALTGGPDGTQQILDMLAGLCDRTRFPAKDAKEEVADGDSRCGAYLR